MQAPYSRTLAELLLELSDRTPDAPAVVTEEGETFSYGDLHRRAAAVAGTLSSLGVGRGDVVALLCTNRIEWLAAAFGAVRVGATVAAFNTWARLWDLEYMLASARPSVLITLDRLRGQSYLALLEQLVPEAWEGPAGEWRAKRFPELAAIAVIGAEQPEGLHAFAEWLKRDAEPTSFVPGRGASAVDTAFIVYTSGSTARPKVVPLLHYAMIENGFNIGERMQLTPDDRVWLPAPLFWSYGCANALSSTFTHGATLVLQEAFDPGKALEIIDRERCTVAYTLPNITAALVSHDQFDRARVASLRTGLTIGLPSDIDRAANELGAEHICNIYGGTETYGNCCVTPADAPLERRLESQGPPLPGVELRIVDKKTRKTLRPGETGEICVRGYVVTGYLGENGLGGALFDADGFFRTGDLGFLDEQGWLHFQARDTDMIKTGGINISPQEVEDFLRQHPAVLEVGVVGVADEKLAEVPVAFVIVTPGAETSPEELKAYCKERIANFKIPARFSIRDALPKTTTGKLDRRTLKTWGEELTSRDHDSVESSS